MDRSILKNEINSNNSKGKSVVKKAMILCLVFICAAVATMSGCTKKVRKTPFEWVEKAELGSETTVQDLDPQYNGRCFNEGDVFCFSFSNSGITFGFKGTSLELEFLSEGDYVAVYIDDDEQRLVIAKNDSYMKIAEGLAADTIHEVTISRRSEGNGQGGFSRIKHIKISDGGTFYTKSYERPRKRIDVLGDSITCGWGNLYDPAKPDATVAEMEDGTKTFATMLADHYDADLTNVSISGIGVGVETNSPYPLLPVYKIDGPNRPHDFTKNVPDLVIIELGTNDASCGNTGDVFIEHAKEYITFLRSVYPEVPIVWYYGIMGESLKPEIETVIKSFTDAGDKNLYAFFTASNPEEKAGGAGHPSLETHIRMAEELCKFLDKNVKW